MRAPTRTLEGNTSTGSHDTFRSVESDKRREKRGESHASLHSANLSELLRQTQEAAPHDKRFRGEVEQALHKAENPQTGWVDHDAVKQDIADQRACLLECIKGLSA